MANKKCSFEQWCKDKHKEDLLDEWNEDKNSNSIYHLEPSTTDYCSPLGVWWKCVNGHEWYAPILKRTVFGLGCPVCNPDQTFIPFGTKYGCLKILGVTSEEDNYRFFDILGPKYRCVCDCGKESTWSETAFFAKKHRFCTRSIRMTKQKQWLYSDKIRTSQCGLKTALDEKKKATYKRVLAQGYDSDLTGTIHESLEVIECVDDHYEELSSFSDLRKKGGGTYCVYKLYKCCCYLCGKQHVIKCSDFSINAPTEYGRNAYNGYWSNAHCDCHPISSFQWIVTKLLKENNVSYKVEVSFNDLFGGGTTYPLRYDFGIYDKDGNIKCLIECQGEQHFKPVDEFGGEPQFEVQQKNDELKRSYAKEHGILLYEISYKNKKYEYLEKYLRERNIIT